MSTGPPSNRRLRVLVAEDEAVIGIDLAQRLAERGHSVLGPFTRRAEVDQWVSHDRPDAAILDLKLLDGTCEDTVRLLRSEGVPIVAFTAGEDVPEDLADMVVIAKPGSPDHVILALEKIAIG